MSERGLAREQAPIVDPVRAERMRRLARWDDVVRRARAILDWRAKQFDERDWLRQPIFIAVNVADLDWIDQELTRLRARVQELALAAGKADG